MLLTRRAFILSGTATAAAACRPASESPSGPKPQASPFATPPIDEIPRPLRALVTAAHPMEQVAKNIDSTLRYCVIDQGAWMAQLGLSWKDPIEVLTRALVPATRARLNHYFPDARSNPALATFVEAGAQLHDDATFAERDDAGRRCAVTALATPASSAEEFFERCFVDVSRVSLAAAASARALLPLERALTRVHELGHALEVDPASSAQKEAMSIAQRMMLRHRMEGEATAMAALELLFQSRDAALVRFFNDAQTVWAFYGAFNGVEDARTGDVFSSPIAYFHPQMAARVLKAGGEDGARLQGTLLKQRWQLARTIQASLAPDSAALQASARALFRARLGLVSSPTIPTRIEEGRVKLFRHPLLGERRGPGLVAEGIERGLLDRRQGFVHALLAAEKRLL